MQAQTKLVFCLLLLVSILRPAIALEEQEFVVESVSIRLSESEYFLNSVFRIDLPDYVLGAVDEGFTLPLSIEIEVYKKRDLWLDEQVAYSKQQYQLNFHSLLDAVSILDVNSQSRQFYSSIEEAIRQMSILVNYPIMNSNALISDHIYYAHLRIGIDYKELPLPLKSSSLWDNNWNLLSDWYVWEIKL